MHMVYRHSSRGFALPSILIASVVMLLVLVTAMTSVVATRTALDDQYYDQLAGEAAESGIAKAQSCLRASAGTVTWSNASPLRPETNCNGVATVSCSASPLPSGCGVMVSNNIVTSFSVGEPTYLDGKVDVISSSATLSLLRSSNKETWRQFTTVSRMSSDMTLQGAWSIAGQIVAGHSHTCAMVEGSMWCWGQNGYGQLGSSGSSTSTPRAVYAEGVLNGKEITYIAAGGSYNGSAYGTTCVVASANPYCWGQNDFGQVGNNSPSVTGTYGEGAQTTPATVVTGAVLPANATSKVAVGGYSACAVTTEAAGLYCWGRKSSSWSVVPEKVTSSALAGRVITDIDMNVNEGICVVASGTVYCNTGSYDSGAFTAVTSGGLSGKTVKKIVWANGSSSRCALTTENRAYCWGSNTLGQLGDATNTTASLPTSVYMDGYLSGRTIIDIEGGSSGTVCATASDFRVYCWGWGGRGLLGRGETEIANSNVPLPIDTSGPVSGKSMISSVVSYAHACALDSGGEAYCWGGMTNVYGQLGNGTVPITKGLPMLVANPNPLSKKPGFFF